MNNNRTLITDEEQRLRIAHNIEILRAYRKTTIVKIFDSLNLPTTLFYRLKRMNYHVYEDEIERVASFFGVKLDDLANKEIYVGFKTV